MIEEYEACSLDLRLQEGIRMNDGVQMSLFTPDDAA